ERGYRAGDEGGVASGPVYGIGSVVPPRGGAATGEGGAQVTTPEEFEAAVALTRQAFLDDGLEEAWNRVIAVVVRAGRLALGPEALVIDRIRDVLRGYAFAVGTGRG